MKAPVNVALKLQNNLKLFRERSNYSQNDIARKAFINRETFSRIEKGQANPSIMTALLISRAIGEEVDKVFYIKEEKVL